MKIAVIGVGGTGSAACRHLAKAGHAVVGYERFRVGHALGSSHGESRIIRYTYPDPLFTRMMGDAYPLWDDLEREAGEELFVRCGGVLIAPPDHPDLVASRDSIAAAGLPFAVLSPEATRERFPAFRLAPDEVALFQRDSGFLRAGRCVLAQARLARLHGAEIREGCVVTQVGAEGGRPFVETEAGRESYDGVIVAAGAWIGKLLPPLSPALSVERRQVVYLATPTNPEQFEPTRFPVWIDAATLYYGFPSDGRVPGIKLASHVTGERVDPDADGREPTEAAVADAVAVARRRFPDAGDTATWTQVCLYTNTENEDFILDQVTGLPNVHVVSGCSGHGFKFTVLLGKIAADRVAGDEYGRDLSRFAYQNFAK